MNFMLPIQLPKCSQLINHKQKILSVGSCFTEHIGNALKELKFGVLQNPNGILFDPVSVCSSLVSYIRNDHYSENDLFYLNELWNSWQHHSRFSGMDKIQVLKSINDSQNKAHHYLKETDWLIITLGSAFSYYIKSKNINSLEASKVSTTGGGWEGAVANCHRAPAQMFQKQLLPVEEIIAKLDNTIHQVFQFNATVNIIFTISPVRHVRDGVVDNNRSKARLIESVHHLVNTFDRLFYFPAYEILIDVLRDYRFYDIDMVHPNYLATDFILQHFLQTYTSTETAKLIEEIKKIVTAKKHRSANPQTEAHKQFLKTHLLKTESVLQNHPYINLKEELDYFKQNS